jgi:hypothetical protein
MDTHENQGRTPEKIADNEMIMSIAMMSLILVVLIILGMNS